MNDICPSSSVLGSFLYSAFCLWAAASLVAPDLPPFLNIYLLPSLSSHLSLSSHPPPPIFLPPPISNLPSPFSYFPPPFLNMSSSHLLLRCVTISSTSRLPIYLRSLPLKYEVKWVCSNKSRQWKTLVVGAGKEKANWMRVKPSPCFSEERFWSPVVCLKKKDIYWVSLTYPLTCKLYIKFTLLKVKPSPCLSKERLWSPSGPCFICWVSLTCSLIMQRF